MNGKEFLELGLEPKSPQQLLAQAIVSKLEKSEPQFIFPKTILNDDAIESLLTALIAGRHVILFGPPGSGKTQLAKEIWEIFPKKIYAVKNCPVQDDPFSLLSNEFSRIIPPCPICKVRYGGVKYEEIGDFKVENVDPMKIEVVEKFMREGFGFARIQGSSEVFPDNLTGTIDIQLLEKIGDPMSPLVLVPGKLLQAHRGMLMIDEIGKLPIGSQNVLLESLQENIVTPAKSRETFPSAFIAVCTSNLDDLENINEPLNDRLANIYVGFNSSHIKNRLILDLSLKGDGIPDIFPEASVCLIEKWREAMGELYELSEVGSNRTMIDIIERSRAYATLKNRKIVCFDDFKIGARDAMLGRIRAKGGESYYQNKEMVEDFLNKNLDNELYNSCIEYWCKFFKNSLKEDVKEAMKVVSEGRERKGYKKFEVFVDYVAEREKYMTGDRFENAIAVFQLLENAKIFDGKKCNERRHETAKL